jgi:hypothetical protein
MLAERESQVQSLQAEHGHSVSSLRHEREQQLNALRQVCACVRATESMRMMMPSLLFHVCCLDWQNSTFLSENWFVPMLPWVCLAAIFWCLSQGLIGFVEFFLFPLSAPPPSRTPHSQEREQQLAALLAEHELARSTMRYEHQQQMAASRAEHQQQAAAAYASYEAERSASRLEADRALTQVCADGQMEREKRLRARSSHRVAVVSADIYRCSKA